MIVADQLTEFESDILYLMRLFFDFPEKLSIHYTTVLANITLCLPALPVRPADILIDLRIVCALHLFHVPLKLLAHAGECRQMAGQNPFGEPAGRGGELVGEGTTLLDSIKYLIESAAGARQRL